MPRPPRTSGWQEDAVTAQERAPGEYSSPAGNQPGWFVKSKVAVVFVFGTEAALRVAGSGYGQSPWGFSVGGGRVQRVLRPASCAQHDGSGVAGLPPSAPDTASIISCALRWSRRWFQRSDSAGIFSRQSWRSPHARTAVDSRRLRAAPRPRRARPKSASGRTRPRTRKPSCSPLLQGTWMGQERPQTHEPSGSCG
jgi:hypothetical protein